MQNVIVTGGAGFIGSSLCKILAKENLNTITVDNLSTGFADLIKYGDFVEGDVGDYAKMMEIFSRYKPIAVFHIAGSKSVSESITNPYKYYNNNVTNTNALLKATVDSDIKYFIFSSSAAIFGIPNKHEKFLNESAAKNPINPYGVSKLMAENILDSYKNAYDLNYIALRYFNVTGADPELELGEITSNPSNIFPLLARAASDKEKTFTIFGNDYDTPDGTCIRDYIHVWDLVNAHVASFKKLLESNNSAVVNLGNGTGFSVQQVINTFRTVTKKDFLVRLGSRRDGDPDSVMADIKFANKYLDWYPKYTNLEDHVRDSWNWHQKLLQKS